MYYHHHFPQAQFMGEEDAEYRNHPHSIPHPYHRYYEQPYMNQPMVSRFAIPHIPQQRPMPPHFKGYPSNNQYNMTSKIPQGEMNYAVQDENINIFNVKAPQQQECLGINRKGISKKNNTPKNVLNEKKQNETIKGKANKREQIQREPLSKMSSKRDERVMAHKQQVFSSDPLIGSLQQYFPSVSVEQQVNIDNASLDQIDNIVKKLPLFYNNQMRDTMKNLTQKQEKLVCNKIKEYESIDVFDEIVKLNPDFELKGLSIQQLNEKLQQINIIFEEQQLKYQQQKQQEHEAYLRMEEELLLLNEQSSDYDKIEPESPTFKKSNSRCIETKIAATCNISQSLPKQDTLKTQDQISKKQNVETNEAQNLNTQVTSVYGCVQFSSPKQDKTYCEAMSEEKKLAAIPSSSECRRIRIRRNSESAGRSGSRSRSQAKLIHGINGNPNLAATFISPFRPTISTNIQDLSSNRKKLLEKSGSCSSFKKGHNQFMDYIDDVIINQDANFGEDDIFRKLSHDVVTIFPINKSDNKNCESNSKGNQLHHHHHHNSNSHNHSHSHLDSYNNKKKYYDCSRIHNFIADEDDYENIQPFVISHFGGSNSKPFIHQHVLSNSNQKSYHQSNTTYNISSFLREIDEINPFSQPGFL